MLAQEEWDKTLSPPCASLVNALRSLFGPLYLWHEFTTEEKKARALEQLQDPTFMLQLFDDSLAVAPEWEDDGPALQITFRLTTWEQDRAPLTLERTCEESEALSSSSMGL
ncbi:hypothetical protein FA95DRAFT_1607765 [Auriscalpium vulgare]|uniref:Uncharacterized protein n=1 Tax=Auriscalpium vulgare TaxID=40419 RepID=A0ACB8RMP2_9AGAM|nr:hypothetical protein FA95DRAFT_1607765 [Auriscalpium vulgare]